MVTNRYAKAYKEIIEILKYFPEKEYKRIPKEKIEFYKEHMDKEYEFTINPTIDLSKQNISKEANAIIVTLFLDYYANEEQKKRIKEILELNQKKEERGKRKKYNLQDLFKEKNKFEDIQQTNVKKSELVEHNEKFFIKFKRFILKILQFKR